MRVLGIAGSPRKYGNSTSLLLHALDGAQDRGHSVQLVHARKARVQPCIACYGCKRGSACVVKDGMTPVYDAIRDADAIVVSTPVYYHSMSGWLKAIVDRTFALLDASYEPRVAAGKKLYVIVVQWDGDTAYAEATVRLVEQGFSYIKTVPAGSLVAGDLNERTDHTARPELLQRAYELIA
jgi:multimeric flavodoxin WrbA